MSVIPTALIGVDHPHTSEWQGVLDRVPDLNMIAAYDPVGEAARTRLEGRYASLPIYDNLSELLARHQVEAALVILSLRQAEEAMLPLARAGVHMMVEKPVARTAAALERIGAELKTGTVFYAGYAWRFDALPRHLRMLVEQGIFGDLWSVEMRWITSKVGRREGVPPHRDPRSWLFRREESRGGMLQWLGCHWIDMMLYITGQPVVSVAAMTARQTTDEIEVDDTATVLLRFGNGMLGSLHVGYLLPEGTQTYWGLRGALGWARHDFQDERRFTVHSQHPDWITAPTKYYDFPVPPNATYGRNSAQALLLDFVRCIRQGGVAPAENVATALETLRVLDAAYEAAETGRTVQVRS